MRIAFLDFGGTSYSPDSVGRVPLGGTESGACYLSRAMAGQGHAVYFSAKGCRDTVIEGVQCIARERARIIPEMYLDAVVCVGAPTDAISLKRSLSGGTRLVRWVGHAADQPPVQSLKNPAEQDAYDGIALVSAWQREQFHRKLGLDPGRVGVMRNGIGFPFQNMFADGGSILGTKTYPPVLVYSSTPFRGLSILLDSFPRIRAAIGGVRLKVFSSLKVYGVSQEQDEAAFGALYQRCRETEGVEYLGSVTQPQLAREMRGASMLSYPNMFPETSCITVMEAMASGCRVVTSALGALPETAGEFGRLVALRPTLGEFLDDFVGQTVKALREQETKRDESEAFLRRQVEFVNQTMTWDVRAREWARWLEGLS